MKRTRFLRAAIMTVFLLALLLVLMLAVSFALWKFQDQILHFVQHLLEKRKKGTAAAIDAARR